MNIEFCYTPEQQKLVERIDLISLPFISTYKNLTWYGAANGTPLTPVFVIGDIQNKVMIIKSFKIANYYHANSVDLYVTDGITTNAETVVAGARMDRLFDAFAGGTTIDFRINNLPVSFFFTSRLCKSKGIILDTLPFLLLHQDFRLHLQEL